MKIRNVKEYIEMPLLYNHWYIAGTVDEFDRNPKAKTLLEKSIVFYRTESGALTALQNRCLHRAFPLSEGKMEGDNIVCGYHGARYNPDGELVRVPCQANTPKKQLRKYTVKEVGPFVMIWMGEGEADEHLFPELSVSHLRDPKYRTLRGYYKVEGSYLFMQENLHDLTHIPYLHKETFKVDDSFYELPPLEISTTDRGVVAKRTHEGATVKTFLPPSVMQAVQHKELWRVDYGVAPSPGIYEAKIITGEGQKEGDGNIEDTLNQYLMHFLTPETKTTCHYWYAVSLDHGTGDDEYFAQMPFFFEAGFLEDLEACKHMQNLLSNDKDDFIDTNFSGDQHGMLFRNVVLKWAKEEYGEDLGSSKPLRVLSNF